MEGAERSARDPCDGGPTVQDAAPVAGAGRAPGTEARQGGPLWAQSSDHRRASISLVLFSARTMELQDKGEFFRFPRIPPP